MGTMSTPGFLKQLTYLLASLRLVLALSGIKEIVYVRTKQQYSPNVPWRFFHEPNFPGTFGR